MLLPSIDKIDFIDKKVLVRADLDVSIIEGNLVDKTRLESLLPTLNYIFEKQAKQIILIGHMGRPEGKKQESLSLRPIENYFKENLTPEICFVDYQPYEFFYQVQEEIFKCEKRLCLLENLRFWPQEEENNQEFAKQLAYPAEVYINEAFASSHRSHASIVGIPQVLSNHAGGLQFAKEVENLSKVFNKPVLAIISGVKKDKLDYLDGFKKISDKILLGGRLPEFVDENLDDPHIIVARLNPDKEDITIHSIEKFEEEIANAGTIILAGPIGKYEDGGHKLGTERVFIAVSQSKAFKIAGGGDTLSAIHAFNLTQAFDWISTGGGAALEFLANSTLPGIEALKPA